jgi:hypothetical protein
LDVEIAGRFRLELGNGSLDAGEIGVVVGFDEEIGEVDVAAGEVDLADGNRFFGR